MDSKALHHKARILVADDAHLFRLLICESLNKDGYEIIQAENGQVAIELYKQEKPDLVLLDVKMPVKNGFDACKEIRQLENGADIPIVMLTSLDDSASVDKAYEIGATDFITKPINGSILRHRIRYLLRASNVHRSLKLSKARLANAQRIAKVGNWEWDIVEDKLHWSKEICRIFGVEPDNNSQSAKAFMKMMEREGRMHLKIALNQTMNGARDFHIERSINGYDEKARTVIMQGEITLDDEGKTSRLSGTIQDISERHEAEERIRYLAYHDTLTGLPNRQHFHETLTKVLQAAEHHQQIAALLFIDLDRFKQVNDSLGHSFGDELIKLAASRIKNYLRKNDCLGQHHSNGSFDIARIGGDEFIAVLTNLKHRDDAKTVADRLIEKISEPFHIEGREIVITASVGIAYYPDNGSDIVSLLKNADTAMHAGKAHGRNNSILYTSAMSEQTEQKLTLENELRKAIKNNELIVHFQPQINTITNKVIGAEALVRWVHPEKGFIPPDAFIGLAEDTGLILPLGKWVLTEACCQTKQWHEDGLKDIRISVNVSSKQFLYDGFLDDVKTALATSNLDPEFLDLELTEGALMGNGVDIINRLEAIKALGVSLSLDDFGTGYSSLSYLTRYPLDTLKIDRSFIMNIGHSEDEAIIKTIIGMARSLHLNIISEGVETEEQLDFLRQYDTRIIQGYLFSKPLSADEFYNFHTGFNHPSKKKKRIQAATQVSSATQAVAASQN